MSEKESNGTRLREIISVIHKHQIARGVTPEKLRLILEDLGPTYIKLGQIMSALIFFRKKSVTNLCV